MKTIPFISVVNAVSELCLQAAFYLPADVVQGLKRALETESSARARGILEKLLANAAVAREQKLALCQDCGTAIFFVELGAQVRVADGLLAEAINAGVRQGYEKGYLRKSIVADPLYNRCNTGDNTPAVIHFLPVAGEALTITLVPKGGGSENMSGLRMLTPSQGEQGVIDFVVGAVERAGGKPCPPLIVGVGLGGTAEQAMLLAKKALLRPLAQPHPQKEYAALENALFARVNATGIGPQGLGGDTTALAVKIERAPCHIASLPVAVNLSCHATRHATVVL
ncbi:MAG: fumarate hydratase [Chitinivibrionales bacterium]|nr:fumarate hydratase [Chitinivibrionales bacterium]